MLISSGHYPIVIIGCVVAGLAIAGCTKDRARPTVSSAIDSGALPDSAPTAVDTPPAAPTSSAATTTPPPAAKPQPKPRLPKPSIDPGRLPNRSKTDTATKPPAPADSSAASAPASSAQDKWLSYDPATNTVTFELIAGPFTFNGYRDGKATLVVPPKANIVMNFVNKDGTPHSAEIISGDGPIPNAAVDAAIPRAYTNKVLEGLPQEASDVMRFPVPESGTYRIFCGVPGHGLSGMWIWMKVDPAAKAPSFGPTKG